MKRWLRLAARAALLAAALLVLAAAVACLVPVRVTVAAIEPRPDTRYWQMSGGYRIAYTRLAPAAGVPGRAPVVFLHGGPGGYVHSSAIRALQPLADAGHPVYLYDQHGSGLSDRLERPKASSFPTRSTTCTRSSRAISRRARGAHRAFARRARGHVFRRGAPGARRGPGAQLARQPRARRVRRGGPPGGRSRLPGSPPRWTSAHPMPSSTAATPR